MVAVRNRGKITQRLIGGWVSSLLGVVIIITGLCTKFIQPAVGWGEILPVLGFGAALLFVHDPKALNRLKQFRP